MKGLSHKYKNYNFWFEEERRIWYQLMQTIYDDEPEQFDRLVNQYNYAKRRKEQAAIEYFGRPNP